MIVLTALEVFRTLRMIAAVSEMGKRRAREISSVEAAAWVMMI